MSKNNKGANKSNEYRRKLYDAKEWKCMYCGRDFKILKYFPQDIYRTISEWNRPTIEHIKARCEGGPNTWDNLGVACLKCNQIQGTKVNTAKQLQEKPKKQKPVKIKTKKYGMSWAKRKAKRHPELSLEQIMFDIEKETAL